MTSSNPLDQMMEAASGALARMDYLACEARCLEALAIARDRSDWAYYARILLPLQESRRQRRMIATEGTVRLGSSNLAGDMASWLERMGHGALVVTRPLQPQTAAALSALAQTKRRYVEVLFADNMVEAESWTLRSFAGPAVTCSIAPPPTALIDQWIACNGETRGKPSPSDWFLVASEALGDAALAQVDQNLRGARRVEAIERCLRVVTDHEILHQCLGAAARAAQSDTVHS